MAASKITYSDKVGIVPRETHINQIWDADMNEIKVKVNTNADLFDALEQEVDVNTLDIIDLESNRAFKNNVVFKTANYTALVSDYIFSNATSGAFTITLPSAINNIGREINVTKTDNTANGITIETVLSQTIIGQLTQVLTNQYDNITLISDGSNWFIK